MTLFDEQLRGARRDRAFRHGPALFLHERGFAELVDRLVDIRRHWTSVLLVGCPDPDWPTRLAAIADAVTVVEPGPMFAAAAGTEPTAELAIASRFAAGQFDLILAIGTLDTLDALPQALLGLRHVLAEDGLLLGVLAGGASLPRLRAAMRAADAETGTASPHVHPRIEAAALAGLLDAAGFAEPVVDVDRVTLTYRALADLVRDLRAMAATNILTQRRRTPLPRAAVAAAIADFAVAGDGGRTHETIDLLYFTGWAGKK